MSRLRTYAPMSRRSEKVKAQEAEYRAVYKVVDQRSEGRCEFYEVAAFGFVRCTKRAADHHHLYKPRRSAHDHRLIVALCRDHHDRCEWPFKRGRLCISLTGGRFSFSIRYASDKFAVREET